MADTVLTSLDPSNLGHLSDLVVHPLPFNVIRTSAIWSQFVAFVSRFYQPASLLDLQRINEILSVSSPSNPSFRSKAGFFRALESSSDATLYNAYFRYVGVDILSSETWLRLRKKRARSRDESEVSLPRKRRRKPRRVSAVFVEPLLGPFPRWAMISLVDVADKLSALSNKTYRTYANRFFDSVHIPFEFSKPTETGPETEYFRVKFSFSKLKLGRAGAISRFAFLQFLAVVHQSTRFDSVAMEEICVGQQEPQESYREKVRALFAGVVADLTKNLDDAQIPISDKMEALMTIESQWIPGVEKWSGVIDEEDESEY